MYAMSTYTKLLRWRWLITVALVSTGVTRQTVMWLVREKLQLPMIERRVSLAEFHAADEVFTTGLLS